MLTGARHALRDASRQQILGEKSVLAANGVKGLATVALRPSGIFGEGDPLLVPTIVAKAQQGKMGIIIGSGANLMDFTYVGNVAQAHLQVAEYDDNISLSYKLPVSAEAFTAP